MTPFIIADIGSAHRGDLQLAFKQIEAAKECGCDAAKFQFYTHRELYGGVEPDGKCYGIPLAWVPHLEDHCNNVGIEFMASAFSPEGIRLLDPHVKRHKLASAEMMHFKMWEELAKTKKQVLVSTGGAHFSEVLTVRSAFADLGAELNLKILECVANYPASVEDYDLTLFTNHQADGLSDHTAGCHLALAALGAGATIFEKHFDATPQRGETPDSPVSMDLLDMACYVSDLKEAATAFGDGIKQPRNQHDMALRWRRRLIATQELKAGTRLSYGVNYGIYRSLKDDTRGGTPLMAYDIEGKMLAVDKAPGDSLFITDVK